MATKQAEKTTALKTARKTVPVAPGEVSKASKTVKPRASTTPVPVAAKTRKPAARTAAVVVKPDGKGQGLLKAGLKALGDVRDGVVQRQTRVVETLLGIQPAGKNGAGKSTPAPRSTLDSIGDSLGFRKLEDVFDQRIAAALERLGVPSAQQFEALRQQVEAMKAGSPAAPPTAATPSARRKR